jgi:2,4-dienoyl-CoA reductase-like NADH-dependent reductase (Old Yellow Enzyme family)
MNLFSSFGKLGLKNRSVMAPMTRYACDKDGLPTRKLAEYYVRRAKNDVALIIIESAAINNTHALGYKNGLQFHTKEHMDAWKPIVRDIQSHGAKVWLQLFHSGRLTVPEITGDKTLSSSAIAPLGSESFWRPKRNDEVVHFQTGTPFLVPTEVDSNQIKSLISEFTQSCLLAQEAGFDGVELHGAHGYLLHQFSHLHCNQRLDEFGAHNFEFVRQCVSQCREAVGTDFTLSYRLSVHMVDNSFVRHDPNELNFSKLVKILDGAGIDVFHASELSSRHPVFGSNLTFHEIIRGSSNKPLIVCGRVSDLDMANHLIISGEADLVAFGRLLISNPNLIELLRSEREHAIRKFDYKSDMIEVF